jgi:hypothetical protein
MLPIPGCSEFAIVPAFLSTLGVGNLSEVLGLRNPDGSFNTPSFEGPFGPIGGAVFNGLWSFGVQVLDYLARGAGSILNQSPCGSGQQGALTLMDAVYGFLRNFFGTALDTLRTPNLQQKNFLCPVDIPDAAQAAQAWLANAIDPATLECWVRASGMRFPEWTRYMEALRSKLSAFQVGQLYLRQWIGEPEYRERIRELGFVRPGDPDDVAHLLEQIPPVSDLVRFMVRDTDDEALVSKFGMDDQFDLKFGPQIKAWSKWQGVDPRYMQWAWRAHWSLPSPTQLFEMLHRLERLPVGDPAHVDQETVTEALIQQDILPYWIPKFLAISRRPLSRIDARRAFQIGAIDRQQLFNAWKDQGYSDENAETLTRFTDKNRLLTLLRSPVVGKFASGEFTLDDLTTILERQGLRSDDIPTVVDEATRRLDGQRRKRCLAAYRKRFLTGELDPADLIPKLQSLGLSTEQIDSITGGWECERESRGKEFTAAMLCRLMEDGLIDGLEFVRRAKKLGWTHDDATILLRSCQRRLGLKQAANEQRELARQARDAENRLKQALKNTRDQERARQSEARQADRLVRANQLRQRRILEAARNYANRTAEDIVDAVPFVREVYRESIDAGPFMTDEVIAALVIASQAKDVTDRLTFRNAVSVALADLLAAGG